MLTESNRCFGLVITVEWWIKWVGEGAGDCYLWSKNVVCMYASGWWLDIEEKTTASNDWIGSNLNHLEVIHLGVMHLWIFCFRKNYQFEWNKPIIKMLLKDISKPYKCQLSPVKVDGITLMIIYFGILFDRVLLMFTVTKETAINIQLT